MGLLETVKAAPSARPFVQTPARGEWPAVEILWMNGANPVEKPTVEVFSARDQARLFDQRHECTAFVPAFA